jgi:hypothetical protein
MVQEKIFSAQRFIKNLISIIQRKNSPPQIRQNKKRRKWKIPPQTSPFPFATQLKNKAAEVFQSCSQEICSSEEVVRILKKNFTQSGFGGLIFF